MSEKQKPLFLCDGDCLFWYGEGKEYCIHIQYEEEPLNPREEEVITQMSDISGTMIWEVLSRLMGKIPGQKEVETEAFLETLEGKPLSKIVEQTAGYLKGKAVVLPVYLYDHSGISLSCRHVYPYTDPFDSRQAGFIAMTKNDALTEMGAGEETWEADARRYIEKEVETYSSYLNGDVYRYTLYEREIKGGLSPWEELDAYGGFYGQEIGKNGMAEEIGYGFQEAWAAGAVIAGKAKAEVTVTYRFEKEK